MFLLPQPSPLTHCLAGLLLIAVQSSQLITERTRRVSIHRWVIWFRVESLQTSTILVKPALSLSNQHYPCQTSTILVKPALSLSNQHYPCQTSTILVKPALSLSNQHYPCQTSTILGLTE
ncbi:hypothetical protein RRG08_035224 [Elysia crispata]|uniref:Secreted protein n=1 Tax=Elysia crispata TaxID=231223 RepID=A0AAE1DJZ5_9GAST|nr:hypothetical protein RRG08_035224 [Elysia crispata]